MKKVLILALALGATSTFAQKGKWVKLFDGKTTNGWHSWHSAEVKGWHVMNGVLMTHGGSGDLVTDKEYENFELEFDFKAAPKGNSGVIYKVIEKPEFGATYTSGPEYQIIDDKGYPSPIKDTQKTAANYDMQPANDLNIVKPAGQWNKGKIIVKDGHVEHWLNGEKVVEYEYGSTDWIAMVAKSKFANWEYANAHAKGKIALQDHGDMVSFRNMRIREL
ncbi:3-keto-disaccharide hydrolase [Emticicia sp. 17c]|uniref:3-keto-disaccharide hydrolase n=1 Tax=Emticicia sp. 17c TaxID=3127704 RepID=UPI00301E2EA4